MIQVGSIVGSTQILLTVGKHTKRHTEKGMVFCYQNWSTVRKNCPSDLEKLLKFEAEG